MKNPEQMTDDELDNFLIQQSSAQVEEMDYSKLSDDELDSLIIDKTTPQSPQDRPGEAFAQGFGNAATFGYLPQIQAATEPLIQGALDLIGGDNTDEQLKEQGFQIQEAPKESYVQRRDNYINQGQQLARENPIASMAGGVSGSIASGIATGGGLNSLLGTTGKALSTAQRFKQAAGAGAIIGAARNPGDTEGEVSPLQLGDRLENAAKDAATGLVIQGGLESIRKTGQAIKGAGKNIKHWSQNKALKGAGADKPVFKKAILNKKNTELGQTVLDENLINAGDDVKDIAKNAESAMKDAQAKLNNVYSKADDVASLGKGDISNLKNEYLQEASERLSGTASGDDIAKQVDDIIGTMPENPTYGELRKWRSSIDDKITWSKANNQIKGLQEELVHLRSKVQEKIASRLGKYNPELKKEFVRQNKRVSNLSDISDMAKKKAAGQEGNTSFGIREGFGSVLGGMLGTAVAGPLGTAPGMALGAITTNYARKHATPFVAMTANKVARALENNKDAIGKFSKPLIDSASNPQKFVATVNALMKDPEFKKNLNEMEGGNIYRGPARGSR